jgi:hypothetical protein
MKYFWHFNPPANFYSGIKSLRYIQYFLYFSGIAIFFFFETIMNFFKNRIKKKIDKKNIDYALEYQSLNLDMLVIVDYIGFSGFIGFLICGNLYWVTIFSLISLFSKLKFFPVHKRNFLKDIIPSQQKEKE